MDIFVSVGTHITVTGRGIVTEIGTGIGDGTAIETSHEIGTGTVVIETVIAQSGTRKNTGHLAGNKDFSVCAVTVTGVKV